MTESQFIKGNIDDWKELEKVLKTSNADPDKVQALFVKVSGDLSYARTYFPRRVVQKYLNALLNQVFDSIRLRQKYKWGARIVYFYKHTLPREVIKNRNAFLIAFVVFFASVFIGIFSGFENEDFLREAVGDAYVTEREHDIEQDDPMALYKDANKTGMFLQITINNIKVAFFAFVLGLFAAVGTIFLLIKNGIMLGAFQVFYYQKGLFLTSFLTLWIHGTIEIASIIVAGAAGIILGRGLLFPSTYSRNVSLKSSAVQALIVLLSTVPLFVMAGFLEGFVTRHTELPTFVKAGIILLSLVFILMIYVFYPLKYYRSGQYREDVAYLSNDVDEDEDNIHSVIGKATLDLRKKMGAFFLELVLPALIVFGGIVYLVFTAYIGRIESWGITSFFDGNYLFTPFIFVVLVVFLMLFFTNMSLIFHSEDHTWRMTFRKLIKFPLPVFLLSVALILSLYFLPKWWILGGMLVFPFAGFVQTLKQIAEEDKFSIASFVGHIKKSYVHWLGFQGKTIIIIFIFFLANLLVESSIGYLLKEFLSWHDLFDNFEVQMTYYSLMFNFMITTIIGAFGYFLFLHQYVYTENMDYAYDLKKRLKGFGQSEKMP